MKIIPRIKQDEITQKLIFVCHALVKSSMSPELFSEACSALIDVIDDVGGKRALDIALKDAERMVSEYHE